MIKRSLLLSFAAFSLTCLSSCALAGNLLRTVLQLPTRVLGTVTEADATDQVPGEAVTEGDAPAEVSITVTPARQEWGK